MNEDYFRDIFTTSSGFEFNEVILTFNHDVRIGITLLIMTAA